MTQEQSNKVDKLQAELKLWEIALEEAEKYKKQIEYIKKYKKYIEEHSKQLDWKNFKQEKYFAEFNCEFNKIDVDCCCYLKHQGVIYASSEKIIWDAINEIGEENFKKYVLEVK